MTPPPDCLGAPDTCFTRRVDCCREYSSRSCSSTARSSYISLASGGMPPRSIGPLRVLLALCARDRRQARERLACTKPNHAGVPRRLTSVALTMRLVHCSVWTRPHGARAARAEPQPRRAAAATHGEARTVASLAWPCDLRTRASGGGAAVVQASAVVCSWAEAGVRGDGWRSCEARGTTTQSTRGSGAAGHCAPRPTHLSSADVWPSAARDTVPTHSLPSSSPSCRSVESTS